MIVKMTDITDIIEKGLDKLHTPNWMKWIIFILLAILMFAVIIAWHVKYCPNCSIPLA